MEDGSGSKDSGRVVVFLDEINTSHHVNILCEAVLERSLQGQRLPSNIDVLAALNPRRKRPPQMQLTTGLVYSSGSTAGGMEEEMGSLVYRVHAVPHTVNDFLFDFGSLTQRAEEMYVRSMVQASWPGCHDRDVVLVSSLLCLSQEHIRLEEGDPSAVSLRDVKRCLQVARWMQANFAGKVASSQPHSHSVVIALALVYHYRLPSQKMRHNYWQSLARRAPWPQDRGVMKNRGWSQLSVRQDSNGLTAMENLVLKVQDKFAMEFEVDADIVMNEALKENVFVGLLCIMNRIPLFIVGKPGTSKTLCMQVLLSNLQGKQSKSKMLQQLPALRIMQYQCSPLSTADGIERQFEAASRFASNALDAQVVLLLDEVGLAEFSPDMPLKVLHGILAEPGDVAVVGLSNWRLDPAKMNRSVCLARPDPDSEEVGRTGAGLLAVAGFSEKSSAPAWLDKLANAFWGVFSNQGDRDWLGMRDYYSFVRSLRAAAAGSKDERPSVKVLEQSIRRNFGGRPDLLDRLLDGMLAKEAAESEHSMHELLRQSIFDHGARHLLVVSDGAALTWLEALDILPSGAEFLLGSDFPEDASEAYGIRQLTRVREAMAKGKTLILSSMDIIYEALYDVLNQRYVRRRSEDGRIERMLRLAIGARSQLCTVADTFKLVVLVDCHQAFNRLDVPFLNRFEKQLLEPSQLLDPSNLVLLQRLESWSEHVADGAGCELVAGGLGRPVLASLLLARPAAEAEELQLAVLDMALPLAVFRSRSLQELDKRRARHYFEVRSSLVSALCHVVSHVASGELGVLCDLATSSPLAHIPREQELSEAGCVQILSLGQLSGTHQLEETLDTFFGSSVAESSSSHKQGAKILILQVDALVGSATRLALARQMCSERRKNAAALARGRHVFLVQHRAGWPAEKHKGFAWQPKVGWQSLFVDDLQGNKPKSSDDGGCYHQTLDRFLTCSVHDLLLQGLVPPLSELAVRWSYTCLVRCIHTHDAAESETKGDVFCLAFAQRLSEYRAALQQEPALLQALEALTKLVLEKWAVPDADGLHLQVRLAMNELRFGSLRSSVHLAIQKLQLAALSHALRWLDTDFNMHHIMKKGAGLNLWRQLAVTPSVIAAPQLVAAVLRPGSALQAAAPVPNGGRHGPLVCKCPFSARLLTLCASTAREASKEHDPSKLRALSVAILGEAPTEAFAAFEESLPGSFLHDIVSHWSPSYPGLSFDVLLDIHKVAVQEQLEGRPLLSPLELLAAVCRCQEQVQTMCSVLSILANAFGTPVASQVLEGVKQAALAGTTGFAGTFVDTVAGELFRQGSIALVRAAQPHIRVLLGSIGPSRSQVGQGWWRLQVATAAAEEISRALGSATGPVDLIPDLAGRGDSCLARDLFNVKIWVEIVESVRVAAAAAGSEAAERAGVRTLVNCMWTVISEVVEAQPGLDSQLGDQDLIAVLWGLVLQEPLSVERFGMKHALPMSEMKSLLTWLQSSQLTTARKFHPTITPQAAELLLGFVEDVEEVSEVRSDDFTSVSTPNDVGLDALRSAARLRKCLAEYGSRLICTASPDANLTVPGPLEDDLLRNSHWAALYVAKVARRLGGDQELCRLAVLSAKASLSWFPVDASRLPRDMDRLPDPFVLYVPSSLSEKCKNMWYIGASATAGQCANQNGSSHGFDLALKQVQKDAGVQGEHLGKCALPVLGCIVSRVLLNPEIATQSGLQALKEWSCSKVEKELGRAKSSLRQKLLGRMFGGDLLPQLEELYQSVPPDSSVARPPKKFLEQLAHHLVLVVLHSVDSSSWLVAVLCEPKLAQQALWPTMPENEQASILGAMGHVGWYTCRNGHPYSVGECTRPMQMSFCPVVGCGLPIGGQNHENVAGVRGVERESLAGKGKPGYFATSELVDQTIANQINRPLTLIGLRALRLILRTALWASLSSEGSAAAVSAIASAAGLATSEASIEAVARVLFGQIAEDWDNLLRSTRLPPRELGAWLQLSLFRLVGAQHVDAHLSTERERELFEGEFQHCSEQAWRDLGSACRTSMDVDTDYTGMIQASLSRDTWFELCEMWRDTKSGKDTRLTFEQVFWNGRAQAGIAEFERFMSSRLEHTNNHPLLAIVAKEHKRLEVLRALPATLAWHSVLFDALGDYAITREEARQMTNQEAISRLPEHMRSEAGKRLTDFCECFNKAFPFVERLFECQANPFLREGKVHLPGQMSSETPVIFSLPFVAQAGETEAPSLCTVQLINVLQTAQNDLVEALAAATADDRNDQAGTSQINISCLTEPAAITALLVSHGARKSLLPFLYCHRCERDGMWNGVEYNLCELEQSLAQHFRGAAKIQVQLRHYRFGGELRDSGRLALLRQRLPQAASLPEALAEEFRREIGRFGAESRRQLRVVLEDVINFCLSLGAGSGEAADAAQARAELLLVDVVDGTLTSASAFAASSEKEPDGEQARLPKALQRGARLKHLQAIYLELVCGEGGSDALAGVALAYQEPLEAPQRAELAASAAAVEWLPVLHDLLVEQLVVEKWPTGCPLREFLGFASGDDPPTCFPEALELRHALATYRALAAASAAAS
eukprot:TRINITY_DN102330_c0_g1_i1.p1 TRINITY_DN102330_c0_g1~~TRINITY_DN102330_c0_g1_i1.p1  ORF type:complete len:2842 (-),score=483.01 TRINITY_DN102330_c0_g1_i1:146-7831(-)